MIERNSFLLALEAGKSSAWRLFDLCLQEGTLNTAPFRWVSLWGTRGERIQVLPPTCLLNPLVLFTGGPLALSLLKDLIPQDDPMEN